MDALRSFPPLNSARNNQEAIITVGQTVPFIDNVTFSQVGQQINTVTYRDIGIILRVTPSLPKMAWLK